MGRRPTKPGSISRLRVRKKPSGKIYYYYDCGGKPRKEIPLGSDYGLAIAEYARLEKSRAASDKAKEVLTFRHVAERYIVEVVPTKSPATQKDNRRELIKLLEFFDDPPAPLDAIEPQHVKQYLRYRGKTAPVRANREKALLSAIWNFARECGYTSLANPCAGIKGHKEKGRSVYVEDDLFAKIYAVAGQPLRDALDLFYLTGQRISDVLALDERDIRDGHIWLTQAKTGARRRIEVSGELAAALDRIATRKKECKIKTTRLVVMESGQPMTDSMLRGRFDAAREQSGIDKADFQLRDLRAKAGTDKAESTGDILQARDQLGHSTVTMTERYIRERQGKKVTPTR